MDYNYKELMKLANANIIAIDKMTKEAEKRNIEAEKRNKEANKRNKEANKRNEEANRRIKKLENELRGMGLTQGDISEEIIADNFGNVFNNIGEEISSIERNLKIYSKGRKRVLGEFDIIGVNGRKVFLGETKTKLRKEHIDKLVKQTIPNFKKYDNRHDGMEVFGVIGTRVFENDKVLDYAIDNGLYVIKETNNGNARILKKSLKNIKSF